MQFTSQSYSQSLYISKCPKGKWHVIPYKQVSKCVLHAKVSVVYIANGHLWWDEQIPSGGNHKDAEVVGSICVHDMCESLNYL